MDNKTNESDLQWSDCEYGMGIFKSNCENSTENISDICIINIFTAELLRNLIMSMSLSFICFSIINQKIFSLYIIIPAYYSGNYWYFTELTYKLIIKRNKENIVSKNETKLLEKSSISHFLFTIFIFIFLYYPFFSSLLVIVSFQTGSHNAKHKISALKYFNLLITKYKKKYNK